MKISLVALLTSLFAVSSVLAVTTNFIDGSGNNWTGYAETGSGVNGFDGTNLFVDNGNSESIGDNFIALDLGATLSQTTVSGVMNFNDSGNTAFYMAINATEAELINFGGAGYNTFTKGYGIFYDMNGTDNIYIVDRSTNVNFNDNPGESLAFVNNTLPLNTDMNFELVYSSSGSLDVTFWQVGQNKPGSATVSYVPGAAPVSSGTLLTFGITDEGRLNIKDLNLNNAAVPEPSSCILALMAIGLIALKKRK